MATKNTQNSIHGVPRLFPPLPAPLANHPRYKLRDLLSLERNGEDKNRVRVEHYIHDKSFKERVKFYFITNQRYSVRWHLFRFLIKVLTCCLYVVRSWLDDQPHLAGCPGCPVDRRNSTKWCCPDYNTTKDPNKNYFAWALLFVKRPYIIWAIQTALAIYGLLDALLISFLNYKKGSIIVFINFRLAIELTIATPFFMSIFWTDLRNIWVLVFLNCWLAKSMLEIMFNDLHRLVLRQQSAVSQKVLIVFGTVFCIIFTSVCGIHHLERAQKEWNFFECIWFVVVTFSTVGYGDHTPPDWPAQTFVMLMIITALVLLPIELEQLAFLLVSRQKEGGAYRRMLAGDRHVVLCATTLRCTTLIDFLNEFYSNTTVQDVHVVLLCPSELDSNLRILLQVPVWSQRVTYLKGSALIDEDLVRARVEDAQGCFILADRSSRDREAADQHTILRTWAVQDFAPATPLFVQILKPKNKFHVSFAEYVVCEDEIKHALLANNCVCPGISTFVTLLLHTLHEQRGSERWHEMYGKCAGNEIYDIRLGESKIFRPYAYKSFTHAAFHAHKRYGVTLIAVRKKDKGKGMILNPGPSHIMNYDDRCFYISISSEEDMSIKEIKEPKSSSLRKTKQGIDNKNTSVLKSSSVALDFRGENYSVETVRMTYLDDYYVANGSAQANRKLSGDGQDPASENKKEVVFDVGSPDSRRSSDSVFVPDESDLEDDSTIDTGLNLADLTTTAIPSYVVGVPRVTPYIGRTPTRCHLLSESKEHCCLKLRSDCEHRDLYDGSHMNQKSKGAIIVASPRAEAGLYNFILPLRAYNRAKLTLKPIVLLLEEKPSPDFLEAVCCFPMLYYMLGNINSLDDLLFAGLLNADTIVVLRQYGIYGSNAVLHDEDHLADASTIVGVQTIYRLFPNASIIVELQHATNMRFMKFNADPVLDISGDSMASLRESIKQRRMKDKNKKDHLNYMFREPFASGSVFSMSMIDTLIYQTFVKDYMITLISLLLGCEQAAGSGYLCALEIQEKDSWIQTYGRLFQKLCSTTNEIPIGIYRCSESDNTDGSSTRMGRKEIRDIHHILENRIQNLKLSGTPDIKKRQGLFYVIVNPPPEFQLQAGDIIYLIRPCNNTTSESLEHDIQSHPSLGNVEAVSF